MCDAILYGDTSCLTGHFCHLTSALGQRAKVISLSQPKVSGKARSSPRGTVGPILPTPSPQNPAFTLRVTNQSSLLVAVSVGPDSVLCLQTNGLVARACVGRRAASSACFCRLPVSRFLNDSSSSSSLSSSSSSSLSNVRRNQSQLFNQPFVANQYFVADSAHFTSMAVR